MPDIGYYTLPVIVSMEGIDKQVNSKLGKAFEGIGVKAGKGMGAGMAPGLKSAESDIKKLTDTYSKLRDKASDSLGKVRKEEAALQDLRGKGITSGARFVAVEERLATARRNSTRAVNDAKRAHTDLEGAQKKLGDGAGKLSGKFSSLEGIAGKASKALGVGLVAAAGAATVGVAALVAGLAVAANELYDLGASFDEISDNFIIKLGATGDKLVALNKQVTSLGNTLALPLEDIAAITTEVNRVFTGTTTELENLTQAVGDLNRMTGTSTDVKKFRQLLIQWNIPMKDSVATLDMLNNVSRKTGKPVNDLMEILTSKGAVGLRELNIPLEAALGLLAQLQEAGLETAAGIDALGKANKYANTEGISMQETMTRAFNAIKAGDDKLAQTIFGVKGSADLIEAVRNGKLTIEDFYAALEAGGPTIAETAALTDDFAQKWQILKNKLSVAIKPAAVALFDTINTKLTQISDWAINNQDKVLTFIGDIGVGLIEAGQSAIDFAQGVLLGVKAILNAINYLPTWLGGPEQDIDTSFIDDVNSQLDGVKNKLNGAKTWWRGYTDRAANAVKLTQALGDELRVVNENNEIVLSAKPSDEITAKLMEEGLLVKEVNGRFTVVPDPNNPAGKKVYDAWLASDQGLPLDAKLTVDTAPAERELDNLYKLYPWLDPNAPAPAAIPIPPLGIPLPPGGGPDQGYQGMPGTFASSGLQPNALRIGSQIASTYPGMAIGGKRSDPHPDHPSGKAIDVMVGDNLQGRALGDRLFARYIRDPGVKNIIWQQRNWKPGEPPPGLMGPRGSRTADHYDHLHIMTLRRGGGFPGYGGGDRIPALLEAGEHVFDKDDVKAMGGHGNVYKFRAGLQHGGAATGAIVWPPMPIQPRDPKQPGGVPNRKPGKFPGSIGLPHWDPGTIFGPPPDDWWLRPVHPDDVLFPDLLSPGSPWRDPHGKWKHPHDRERIRPFGFEAGGRVPDWDAIAVKESGGRWNLPSGDRDSTGGLQIRKGTWDDFDGPALTGHEYPYQATKQQQIMIAERILAKQGPGAWAGGKNFVWKAGTSSTVAGMPTPTSTQTYTRGTGPGGEAGYYEPADAAKQQQIRDEIATLEGKAREQKAKIAELESDATESEKISAQNELDETNRELSTKRTELGEAERGKFVEGEPPKQVYEPYPASEVQAAEDKAAAAAGKLREAEARQRELAADATESERIKAQNDIDTAKREKAEADAAVAEKRKGKLTDVDAGDEHKVEIDPQIQKLGELPGLLVNGLLETLGIGDIFPDFTQTPMWKSFAGGISAFKGPLQGLVEGKLGIQQPGWRPGMPIPEPAGSGEVQATAGGGGSVLLPFGLPNIEIPPAPGPPEHGGAAGAPPGPVTTNIDASVNYPPGTVIGVDPVEQARVDNIKSSNAISRVGPIAPDR